MGAKTADTYISELGALVQVVEKRDIEKRSNLEPYLLLPSEGTVLQPQTAKYVYAF